MRIDKGGMIARNKGLWRRLPAYSTCSGRSWCALTGPGSVGATTRNLSSVPLVTDKNRCRTSGCGSTPRTPGRPGPACPPGRARTPRVGTIRTSPAMTPRAPGTSLMVSTKMSRISRYKRARGCRASDTAGTALTYRVDRRANAKKVRNGSSIPLRWAGSTMWTTDMLGYASVSGAFVVCAGPYQGQSSRRAAAQIGLTEERQTQDLHTATAQ
jgi:hypothetical protein